MIFLLNQSISQSFVRSFFPIRFDSILERMHDVIWQLTNQLDPIIDDASSEREEKRENSRNKSVKKKMLEKRQEQFCNCKSTMILCTNDKNNLC